MKIEFIPVVIEFATTRKITSRLNGKLDWNFMTNYSNLFHNIFINQGGTVSPVKNTPFDCVAKIKNLQFRFLFCNSSTGVDIYEFGEIPVHRIYIESEEYSNIFELHRYIERRVKDTGLTD